MSAGTGVRHSEYNASDSEPVRLLQIWLTPNRLGVAPGYGQQHFGIEERRRRLALLVSPDGRDGSIATHQDALMYATLLAPGESVELALAPGRQIYVQLARGRAEANGTPLVEGDGARLTDETRLRLCATQDAEALVFDLP